MKSCFLSVCFLSLFYCSIAQNNLTVELLYHWEDTSLVPTSAYNNTYNEVWGFVQDQREYAVIGSTAGTHIFDITEPISLPLVPIFVPGSSQGPHLVHRDYHDYEGYLYIVADEGSNSTLKVLDLSFLPDSVSVVYNSDSLFTTAHNIFIDSATARMYACGPNYTDVEIISLTNPENPVLLLHYDGVGYVHDVYVHNDTAFLNAGGNGLYIVDFSDIGNPQMLGSLTQYPYKGYNHSGWISEDGNSYFFADENHGYKMKSIDISDYGNIGVIDTFFSEVDQMSMPHNLIVKGNYLYVSHYHDGLQIFDISDPANVEIAGSYDTYTPSDHVSYRGAWGVYPFLPSGSVLVSDMQTGLYVFGVEDPLGMNLDSVVKRRLKLYPNPSSGELTLLIPEDCNSGFQISIYDVCGKRMFSKFILDYSFESIELNLEGLYSGVYMVEFVSEEGKWNARIIKK